MTIEEIKNEVAKEWKDSYNTHYNFWTDMEQDMWKYGSSQEYRTAWLEVCKRYATECCNQQLEQYKMKLKINVQQRFEWAHAEDSYTEMIKLIDENL